MTQNQSKLFSCGLELASFVASSDLLTSSCKLISDLDAESHSDQNLFCEKVSEESCLTIIIIAFGTTQNHVQSALLPFSIDMNDNPFKFICSKANPNFSLNQSKFTLFNEYRTELGQLKSKKRWIRKRNINVHSALPLLGDQKLQQYSSQSSYLNSCLLNVIALKEPCLASPISDEYRSFGLFLFCSDHGSACFENHDYILKIQKGTSQLNPRLQIHDYRNVVENLKHKSIKDFGVPNSITNSNQLKACLSLQLCALGFPQLQ
ncbi:senescence-associated carboxylesterase 101-like [Prosopis cineraria]|uniref:senescence-associated carboxylesterase 101-like n=1 Tax=Prosopis cineraria TaxID=364024 RepID=UPI00240F571B|nr:senescence-associated carboxylesterase 101-like [Prosopis cineraria]